MKIIVYVSNLLNSKYFAFVTIAFWLIWFYENHIKFL